MILSDPTVSVVSDASAINKLTSGTYSSIQLQISQVIQQMQNEAVVADTIPPVITADPNPQTIALTLNNTPYVNMVGVSASDLRDGVVSVSITETSS